MDNFQLLGSLALRLHQEFVQMYYMLLPVFFSLAIAVDWFRHPTGSSDFLDTLKRAFIATLLVASFQEISDAVLAITSGIADKISDMNGLDSFIKMAGEKTKSYTLSPTTLLLGFNDLVIAFISFLSYLVLYIARYITVALYHFMWIFLSILAPLLMLFNLFRGTSQITVNLFKSLFEVASYKIVWAVMSAMMTSLSFGNIYAMDGNYLTVILLNFIIALAMLGTPLIVKSLVGSGLSSLSESLGAGAIITMASVPSKATSFVDYSRAALNVTGNIGNAIGQKLYPNKIDTKGVWESTSSPLPPLHSPSSPKPPSTPYKNSKPGKF